MTGKKTAARTFKLSKKFVAEIARFRSAVSVSDKIKIAKRITPEAKKQMQRPQKPGGESPRQVVMAELEQLVGKGEANRFLAIADLPEGVISRCSKKTPDGCWEVSFTHMLVFSRLTMSTGSDRLSAQKITNFVSSCFEGEWSCKRLRKELSNLRPARPRPSVRINQIRSACELLVTLLDDSTGIFKDQSLTRIKSKDVAEAINQTKSLVDKLAKLEKQVQVYQQNASVAKSKLEARAKKLKKRVKKSKTN